MSEAETAARTAAVHRHHLSACVCSITSIEPNVERLADIGNACTWFRKHSWPRLHVSEWICIVDGMQCAGARRSSSCPAWLEHIFKVLDDLIGKIHSKHLDQY
ncbi:hypothetical protein PMIN06_010110 [Paraphaeosphaeria minitans]